VLKGLSWSTSSISSIAISMGRLGDGETVAALPSSLASAFAGRIVHVGSYGWARKTPDLDVKVQEVLEAALRAHDAALLGEFERRLHEHYLIAAGPQEVINALRNGQVGYAG
jgi:hypothetical protein